MIKKAAKTVWKSKHVAIKSIPYLRYTEYYGTTQTSDKLYQASKQGKTFSNLFRLVSNSRNIRLAYRNIKRNQGSKTPGTDNKSIINYEKLTIKELITLTKNRLEAFKPGTVRRDS